MDEYVAKCHGDIHMSVFRGRIPLYKSIEVDAFWEFHPFRGFLLKCESDEEFCECYLRSHRIRFVDMFEPLRYSFKIMSVKMFKILLEVSDPKIILVTCSPFLYVHSNLFKFHYINGMKTFINVLTDMNKFLVDANFEDSGDKVYTLILIQRSET